MDNVRYNISPCSPEQAAAFVSGIDENRYIPRSRVQADERSHYDRYSYLKDDSRVAIVYDTTAHVISITAGQESADELLTLFSPDSSQSVKRSTVPAQSTRTQPQQRTNTAAATKSDVRSKVFVSPKTIRQSGTTVIATSKGAEVSTDEIYPPQRVYRRNDEAFAPAKRRAMYSYGTEYAAAQEPPSTANRTARVRSARISFGDEDYKKEEPSLGIRTRGGTGVFSDISSSEEREPEKRRRGRPPKTAQVLQEPEYKNGYSVKNYPKEALSGILKRLRSFEKYRVATEGVEFSGTPQEIRSFSVTDDLGQKVILRYATNKKTLSLQGKRSDLFGEIQSQVSKDTDYSSALEGYVESGATPAGKSKVSEVQMRLKKRLPTAFDFLSEQSRIDFSYGIHDFGQTKLDLSDYSALLVPPYRGLERFVFDLQRAEGINVKMIGQAYDKDDSGRYILKHGYQQRIGSVVYCEVMVALYTEYFSRRNFFAHSDNTDGSVSRSITDRNVAKRIFDNMLDIVEYNAKKLKEIGFTIDRFSDNKH